MHDETIFSIERLKRAISDHIANISTEVVGWLAVVLMHSATIPPLLGLILGVSDRLPSIDVVAFIWSGLLLMFIKALISKDMLNIITIGVGFVIQACLLGFLIFR